MVANVFPESGPGQDVADDLHSAIRQRAEEIYERSGKLPGHDIENWIQAEQEIRSESEQRTGRRTAVVVKIDGIDYVGEYEVAASDGYAPGEFAAGEAIAVRFEADRMYVKRPNGKELETRIVKMNS